MGRIHRRRPSGLVDAGLRSGNQTGAMSRRDSRCHSVTHSVSQRDRLADAGYDALGARARVRRGLSMLAESTTFAQGHEKLRSGRGPVAQLMRRRQTKSNSRSICAPTVLKERIAWQSERIEMAAGRNISRGTGVPLRSFSWPWANVVDSATTCSLFALVLQPPGAHVSSDKLRRSARCTVCGHKGATVHPRRESTLASCRFPLSGRDVTAATTERRWSPLVGRARGPEEI